ncbi:MAG TPA: patatin-like phospholipase family protein [Thermoleophilaceae bacterium]|nr:patatin-like phospholipase family protein [Thermoleophilaceae bacterium]
MDGLEQPPGLLALGGGGILGEAWMTAVLAGIEEGGGFDAREAGRFIGTSAGSIVAAALAGGVSASSRLGERTPLPALPSDDSGSEPLWSKIVGPLVGVGGTIAAPVAALALTSTARPGALARRAALSRAPVGRRSLGDLGSMVERSGVTWDGRLLVATVELESGRRVMFGADGAPDASVSEAVQASCAIPGVFRPVRVDGHSYVDGGAWSPTNMDAVPVGRGEPVLCLNPTGSLRFQAGSFTGAMGPLSRSIAGAEALALRHRGARVTTVNPDRACAEAMGMNLMDPSGRADVTAAGLEQGRRLAASG